MALRTIQARHKSITHPGRVAVVVGGTAGIGAAIAKRLAQADVNVVVVGRSEERGKSMVQEMGQLSNTAKHEFVRCDGKLLANAADFAKTFASSHSQLDYLVLTQGIATMQGRTETSEGIDEKLSLHYYARVAFIEKLAPLMTGPDARVLTVLSAGVHSPFEGYAADPELKTTYSLVNAANIAGFYNDIAVDKLSEEHKNISFIHAAPGVINTNWGTELPTVARWLIRMIQPLFRSAEDCAEYMSCALFDPEYHGGWFLMNQYGQPAKATKLHAVARDEVWENTKAVLTRVFGQQGMIAIDGV